MRITVCYASETGTAEDVGFKILKRAESLQLDVEIVDIEDYNIESLPNEQIIVFVCSTTGDGEAPMSMRQFWKFILRKSLPSNSLQDISYGIFGLGDSGYDKFNAVARRLNSRLKQLGATELVPIGLGDDQGAYGYLTALDPWMELLFAKLCPLDGERIRLDDRALAASQYEITKIPSSPQSEDMLFHSLAENPPLGYQTTTNFPLKAIVTTNNRLTTPSWQQNVFHIEMQLPSTSTPPSHVAGDVLVVYPTNPPEIVSLAESYFSEEFPDPENTVVKIQYKRRKNSRKNRLLSGNCAIDAVKTMKCTVRQLFTYFVGLSSVPQRGYFEELSRFVPSPNTSESLSDDQRAQNDEIEEEWEKLIEISSAEGASLYDSYCFQEKRGYMEVLAEFRTLRNGRVPLNRFLDMVPPLLPRHYSIASSGIKTPNEVHLCVAEVAYSTPLGRERKGIASHFLSILDPGDNVYCYVRKGTFPTIPLESPLLLIGPGTGVAPMRALLEERMSYACHSPNNASAQSPQKKRNPCFTMLLFGCRSQQDDFLYELEWCHFVDMMEGNGRVVLNCTEKDTNEIVMSRVLEGPHNHEGNPRSEVFVVAAFSRKGRNAGRRVTHSIRTHHEVIWSLLQREDAYVLVAGSASTKMPSDVRRELVNICETVGGLDSLNAQKHILRMERERRYCVEAWS